MLRSVSPEPEPGVAIDARVDERVMTTRGEGGVGREAMLDRALVFRAERSEVRLGEKRPWRRVGGIEALERNAEQVKVVAMVVRDRHAVGFRGGLGAAHELVQPVRELDVRQRALAA